MIPCWRIESTSSCIASRPNSLRGCSGLGTMRVSLACWILSPESTSGRATDGLALMSEARPLPRPDFAMWLRLPEQSGERKRQRRLRAPDSADSMRPCLPIEASSRSAIHPIPTMHSCSTRWRKTKSTCAVIALNIGSETFKRSMNGPRAASFISPPSQDPDDAFMFYAMAENKIDLRGYRFEHRLRDIQTLNEWATRGELHISAISIHAYAHVADKYALMPCGASMGDGYGPMVITTTERELSGGEDDANLQASLRDCVIAVPGRMTSAYLALQLFLGDFKHVVVPFDQIFDTVKGGGADAGLD